MGRCNPRRRRTERGGGGGGGVIRLSEAAFRLCLKTGYFSNFSPSKVIIFKWSTLLYSFFRMAKRDVTI